MHRRKASDSEVGAKGKQGLHVPPDSERADRSEQEMAEEAGAIRLLLLSMSKEDAEPTSHRPS